MNARELGFGKITDAGVAELRSRLGKELRHLKRRATVSDEWIERYAFGIGDPNPLWTDRSYALRSKHKRLLAPPSIVYALSGWDIGSGLAGVHGLYVRSRIEWFRPIVEGDVLDSIGRMHEVSERPSRFAGRAILQGVEIVFTDQKRNVVCNAQHWNLRTERAEAQQRGTHLSREKQSYSRDEITRIENEIFREEIRGDLPRRWSDVKVGDELPSVIKGPLTVTDMVGYMRGGFGGISHGFFMYTHGTGTAFRRRHPDGVLYNGNGVPDSPEAVHWDDSLARESGLAAAYDLGPQRIGWMTQVITNWAGDDGFLKLIDVSLKKIVLMSDTVRCSGRVTSTERLDGRGQVTLAITATNQLGEVVAEAQAVAELPD